MLTSFVDAWFNPLDDGRTGHCPHTRTNGRQEALADQSAQGRSSR